MNGCDSVEALQSSCTVIDVTHCVLCRVLPVPTYRLIFSVVNKYQSHKAKAKYRFKYKYSSLKAKAEAKHKSKH